MTEERTVEEQAAFKRINDMVRSLKCPECGHVYDDESLPPSATVQTAVGQIAAAVLQWHAKDGPKFKTTWYEALVAFERILTVLLAEKERVIKRLYARCESQRADMVTISTAGGQLADTLKQAEAAVARVRDMVKEMPGLQYDRAWYVRKDTVLRALSGSTDEGQDNGT